MKMMSSAKVSILLITISNPNKACIQLFHLYLCNICFFVTSYLPNPFPWFPMVSQYLFYQVTCFVLAIAPICAIGGTSIDKQRKFSKWLVVQFFFFSFLFAPSDCVCRHTQWTRPRRVPSPPKRRHGGQAAPRAGWQQR